MELQYTVGAERVRWKLEVRWGTLAPSSADGEVLPMGRFTLAAQVGRVPSMVVPLDQEQERRFERLMDDLLMIDMHQHVQVLPEPVGDLFAYARERQYTWGYDAARAGGWSTVTTANGLSTIGFTPEMSFVDFADLATEIALMMADVAHQGDAVATVQKADDILAAKQRGALGWLPTWSTSRWAPTSTTRTPYTAWGCASGG
jgi:hypothetical protein